MSGVVAVIGTKGAFPRLVDALALRANRHPGETVWVQHGVGALPAPLVGAPQIPRAELLEKLRDADVAVVHAGGGAILDALRIGHVPVVVPRLARLQEHVNDHQLEIVEAMGNRIVPCLTPEDPAVFDAAIAAARGSRGASRAWHDPLEERLRRTVDHLIGPAPSLRTRLTWRLLASVTRAVRVDER